MSQTEGKVFEIIPPPAVPAPLQGADGEHTFTHESIVRRLPAILKQVREALGILTPDVDEEFDDLEQDIATGARLKPLGRKDWDCFLSKTHTWLTAPWFLVENYFYKRILAIICYKSPADDPFRKHKEEALSSAAGFVEHLVKLDDKRDLRQTLLNSLWGNQADLSLSCGVVEEEGSKDRSTDAHILQNDCQQGIDLLSSPPQKGKHLIWVLDNCGKELVSDLVCIDELLRLWFQGEVPQMEHPAIHIHAKDEPTFVSDAIVQDIHTTLQWMKNNGAKGVVERLSYALDSGVVSLSSHAFYTSPLPMWEMSTDLLKEFTGACCAVFKGDANYRRLLGDCHWKYTTPFADVLNYMPCSVLALRTLKSEVLVGVSGEKVEEAKKMDPHWLTNGKFAVISVLKK